MANIICPICGTPNDSQAITCSSCHSRLVLPPAATKSLEMPQGDGSQGGEVPEWLAKVRMRNEAEQQLENEGSDWLSERLKPSGPLPSIPSEASLVEPVSEIPTPPSTPEIPPIQEAAQDSTPGWLEQLRASTGSLPTSVKSETTGDQGVPVVQQEPAAPPTPPEEGGDWLQELRKTGEIHPPREEKQVMETASDWLEKLTMPLQHAAPAPGFEDTFRPLEPEPPTKMDEIDLNRLTGPLGEKPAPTKTVAELPEVPDVNPPAVELAAATPLPFEDISKDLEEILPAEGSQEAVIQPEMNLASIFPPSTVEAPASAPPVEPPAQPVSSQADVEIPPAPVQYEPKLPPMQPATPIEPDILARLDEKPESPPPTQITSEKDSKLPFDLNLEDLESAPHSINIEAIPESTETPDWLQQYSGEVTDVPELDSSSIEEGPVTSNFEVATPGETPVAPVIQPAADAPQWLQNILGDTPSTPGDLFKSIEEPLGSKLTPPDEEAAQPGTSGEPVSASPAAQPPVRLSQSGRLPDWLTELDEIKPASTEAIPEVSLPEDISSKPDLGQESLIQPLSVTEGSAFPEYIPGGDISSSEDIPGIETTPSVEIPIGETEIPVESIAEIPQPESSVGSENKNFSAEDLFSPVEELQPAVTGEQGSSEWLKSIPSLEDLPPSPQEEEKAASKESSLPPSAEISQGDFAPPPTSPQPDVQAVSSSPFEIAALPDWLSTESDQDAAVKKPGEGSGENLAPAEMPSWLQALKPQTKPPQISASQELDGRLESSGPLAGFTGVLPGTGSESPIHGGTSDALPRLTASDVQRKYASLMDAVLNEETPLAPPVKRVEARKSRLIRLAATAAAILLLLFVIVFGTQILDMPGLFPLESVAFHNTLESLPVDSKVLIAFDYDPAYAGELQSISQTILDQLIVKNAGLIFISTLPSGPVLADDLLNKALIDQPQYDRELTLNLGYLAGGSNGLQELTTRPTTVITRAWNRLPAWSQPAVAGIERLSQFDGIILITDSFETGRAWIEQVQPTLEGVPLLIASSAQSSPLFQPYLGSGQVDGMIAGYAGEAAYDQILGIQDGVRSKWDAFMIGQSLMILIIMFGATWQFIKNRPAANKRRKENPADGSD